MLGIFLPLHIRFVGGIRCIKCMLAEFAIKLQLYTQLLTNTKHPYVVRNLILKFSLGHGNFLNIWLTHVQNFSFRKSLKWYVISKRNWDSEMFFFMIFFSTLLTVMVMIGSHFIILHKQFLYSYFIMKIN